MDANDTLSAARFLSPVKKCWREAESNLLPSKGSRGRKPSDVTRTLPVAAPRDENNFPLRLALYQDTATVRPSARFDTGVVFLASAEEVTARLSSSDFKG